MLLYNVIYCSIMSQIHICDNTTSDIILKMDSLVIHIENLSPESLSQYYKVFSHRIGGTQKH